MWLPFGSNAVNFKQFWFEVFLLQKFSIFKYVTKKIVNNKFKKQYKILVTKLYSKLY